MAMRAFIGFWFAPARLHASSTFCCRHYTDHCNGQGGREAGGTKGKILEEKQSELILQDTQKNVLRTQQAWYAARTHHALSAVCP